MLAVWMVVLLAVVGGLTLLLRVVMKGVGGVVGRATYERHTAAEEIASTGGVPAAWRARAGEPPWGEQERRGLLRRLDELIRYFEHAGVFDGEEARGLLLEDLRAARARWERGEWEAIPPS